MSPGPQDATRPGFPTPDEVRAATFSQSQLAWRGYSEDEVRAYLAKVADTMVAGEKERMGLRAEIDRLRNFYREHGADVDRAGGGSHRRRTRVDEDDLVRRVGQYTDVQLERAKRYATLIDGRAAEQADEVFHHAKVQAALATEQSVQTRLDESGLLATVAQAELERASSWLRAFAYALHAQFEVTNDALHLEAHRLATPPARRR